MYYRKEKKRNILTKMMEDEPAFHLLCSWPSLISLRMHTFSKTILSIEEYEGASALLQFALASVTP
jgi:hypothetical protein